MDTMSKFGKVRPHTTKSNGKGRGDTGILKLVCDHQCLLPLRFVQQAGWGHHFLPVCDCKEHPYFRMPSHIHESQYQMYMEQATTEQNEIVFCHKEIL